MRSSRIKKLTMILLFSFSIMIAPSSRYDTRAYIPNSVTAMYQNKIIEKAQSYLGVDYVLGGSTHSGIDCSGLTKNVYSEAGVNYSLPHNAAQQYSATDDYYLPNSTVTGEIAFRSSTNSVYNITHCAVRVNHTNGLYIHAPQSNQQVCYTSSSFSWFTAPSSWLY